MPSVNIIAANTLAFVSLIQHNRLLDDLTEEEHPLAIIPFKSQEEHTPVQLQHPKTASFPHHTQHVFTLPSFSIAKTPQLRKLAKEIEVALILSVCYICNAIVVDDNHIVSFIG